MARAPLPLGTLDRSPPPFFKQGPSALSRLILFSALAVFLMVADLRFRIGAPARAVVSAVIFPLQWMARQPAAALAAAGSHFSSLSRAQEAEAEARRQLARQSLRAGQVEQLMLENQRLRELLDLRQRQEAAFQAAEVLYEAADPHSRKIVIDRGMDKGVRAGSPVLDDAGVLGQVTRVYPLVSEVTLLIDRDHAIPLLNARTGARSVGYGEPGVDGGVIELRFISANADVQDNDLMTTSGVDGIYPPGLPVARIARVERRADSAFARIHAVPISRMAAARHVVVLGPVSDQLPARPPEPAPVAVPTRRGRP
jgi:rod shape-determining protein MreC